MTLPFTLPDWLPWWVPIVLLVPALLYALAFLFMPFSVIGLKGRLEAIEARLDEIQGEIRHVTLRMPEVTRSADFDEIYAPEPADRSRPARPVISRPPIPPAAHELGDGHPGDEPRAPQRNGRRESDRGGTRGRAEPRLDWPR